MTEWYTDEEKYNCNHELEMWTDGTLYCRTCFMKTSLDEFENERRKLRSRINRLESAGNDFAVVWKQLHPLVSGQSEYTGRLTLDEMSVIAVNKAHAAWQAALEDTDDL